MSLRLKQYYEFGPFRIDAADRLLYRGGTVVSLPPRAFDLLLLLIRKKGQTVDRKELMRVVSPNDQQDAAALSFNVYKLRRALGETGARPSYIATVPGKGYRFVAEVRETWDDEGVAAACSIAVLPFRAVEPDGGDEYLGLGLADALITRLGKLRQVMVRPTSAVTRYDQMARDPLLAGRKLKVGSVLDGSIRRAGDRVQVSVQLVSVPDEAPVWTESFEYSIGELFNLEDSISGRVARALSLGLTAEEEERLASRHTRNPLAYQEYLKGRYCWNKRTPAATKEGIAHFERAIQQDPAYALAYAGLADCYSLLSFYSVLPPRESFPRAREAARRALELDESLAEAHASLGYVKLYYDWDWVGAEKEFRRAISLNPNYATARHWYHEFLMAMGWFDEAMAEVKRAYELDPVSPVINAALVLPLIHAGQYDKAIERLRQVLELDHGFYRSHLFLGAAYTQKKEFGKAIAEFQVAVILSENSTRALAALGYAYALAGKKARARGIIHDLKRQAEHSYVAPYAFAMIHAGLGERDEAFEWLKRAFDVRDEWLVRLKIAPELSSLRSDARFVELLRKIGLAP